MASNEKIEDVLVAKTERVFATAEQVIAVLEISKRNVLGRKRKKDCSYERGMDDLIREVERWLSN